MTQPTAIAVRGLSKTFGARPGASSGRSVLRGVDVSIRSGEFVCILGPSGCGKSTFLNILAGLDRDFTGEVEIQSGARVGYLFQEPRLLPWLTAEKNVDFGLANCKIPRERWAELKDRYFAMAGLSDFRSYHPHQMSGGMAQRLALVRALCVEPAILLMDEPFSGLDELTARRIREDLLKIWRTTGKTIVFVTHNAYEASFLADRILMMSHGVIRREIPVPIPRPRSYDNTEVFELNREVVRMFLAEVEEPQVVTSGEPPVSPAPSRMTATA